MNALVRRVEALESVTPSDALPVEVIRFVGLRADGGKPDPVSRAEAWGLKFRREDGETEDAFMARVKAQRPAGNRALIMAF